MPNITIQTGQPTVGLNPMRHVSSVSSLMTGVSSSNASSPISNQHERVTLFLGTPQSADITMEKDLLSTIGGYLHRLGNKDLAQYPLVFSTRQGYETFCQLRDKLPEASATPPPRSNDDKGLNHAFLYAIKNIDAHYAGDFNFNPDQKIYIVGGGKAGLDAITVGDRYFTMGMVAQILSNIGVHQDTKDIRLTSSASADATVV
ncbi:hypothetical protein ACSHDQ_002604, partial [Edwardsiella ictaluri]